MIRGLTIATGILAAGWSGYWFVAAQAARGGAEAIVSELRDGGWQVSYSDLSTRGFPSRIDTTLSDLALADPATGIGWNAPFLQVFALSYRPNEIIAAWPEEQTIALPGQTLTVRAEGLMASARVGVATDLPLEQATVQSGLITLASDAGWQGGASHLLAAFRRAPGVDGAPPDPASYDIFADLAEIALPVDLLARLDPGTGTPAVAGRARLDAGVRLDAPLARGTEPGILGIVLRDLRGEWGPASIALRGEVAPDAAGLAEGRVEVELRNWPLLLDLMSATGLVPAERADMLRNALSLAAQGDRSLSAALTLGGGMVSLGFVPLGPAPRLLAPQRQ
ncbi:MAG: DUF2125 domain-containing protein [Rubellimicrobium sp.]|nr:DUF2125 domain-containing protein [Rubellimicrobium sp.]